MILPTLESLPKPGVDPPHLGVPPEAWCESSSPFLESLPELGVDPPHLIVSNPGVDAPHLGVHNIGNVGVGLLQSVQYLGVSEPFTLRSRRFMLVPLHALITPSDGSLTLESLNLMMIPLTLEDMGLILVPLTLDP